MRGFIVGFELFLLTFLVGCTHARPWQYPIGPRATLHSTRQVAMAGQPVTFWVAITNSDEELWCPGLRWIWPDETTTTYEADCSPFEAQSSDFWGGRYDTGQTKRFGPGSYTITVELFKGDRTIRKLHVTVRVGGDTGVE